MIQNRFYGNRRLLLYILPAIAIIPVLAYHILFFPSVFEKIVTGLVNGGTDAELTLTIDRSSLFFGFEAHDIQLTDTVGRKPIFRAKRLNLSYFLPSIFAGHIGIRDFTLLRPEIFIDYSDGRWNYSSLFPPPPPRESPPSDEPPRVIEEVSLVFPIKLYANANITDLSIHFSEKHNNISTNFKLYDINFIATVITSTFRKIPLNSDALNLLDTFVVALNPFEKMGIEYEGNFGLVGNPELSLVLFHDRGSGETDFTSRFKWNSHKSTIFRNRGMPLPLGLSADYLMIYDSRRNALDIRTLKIIHEQSPLLSLTAKIGNVREGTGEYNIAIEKSRIDLYRIAALLNPVINDPSFRLGGIIASGPFTIFGKPENLRISGLLRANNFIYSDTTQNHSMPYLNVDIDALIDAYAILPFLSRPEHYAKSRLAFGLFHSLQMRELTCAYNGAYLRSSIRIDPKRGIDAGIFLSNFEIGTVTAPDLTGRTLLDISFHSPESFERIGIRGRILLQRARYSIERSSSSDLNLSIETDAVLNLMKEKTVIDFHKIHLIGENDLNETFLDGSANAVLSIGEQLDFNGFFHDLFLNGEILFPVLPASLQHALDPIRVYLSQGLRLTSSRIDLHLSDTLTAIKTNLLIDIPYIKLSDLFLNMDISISQQGFDVRSFHLSALNESMSADAAGLIRFYRDRMVPSIRGRIALNGAGPVRIHNNLTLSGGLNLDFSAMPERTDANIRIENLNVLFESNGCGDGLTDCRRYTFESLNFAMPIHHVANPSANALKMLPIIPVPNTPTYRKLTPNLSLRYVAASHNPRGEAVPGSYYYIGTANGSQESGLSANIEYVNNTLRVNNLRIRMFGREGGEGDARPWRNAGVIDGENIYINLADLNPEKMQFGGDISIKKFDLEPYMPRSRSRYDGVISADLSIRGKNLASPLYGTSARLSVHRLSPQFSGFATRIVMPDQITARMVQGTLKIPSILLELKGGMVYSRIAIERGGIFPGAIIRPSGEEIGQERIPLAVFLERAAGEARTFTE